MTERAKLSDGFLYNKIPQILLIFLKNVLAYYKYLLYEVTYALLF